MAIDWLGGLSSTELQCHLVLGMQSIVADVCEKWIWRDDLGIWKPGVYIFDKYNQLLSINDDCLALFPIID